MLAVGFQFLACLLHGSIGLETRSALWSGLDTQGHSVGSTVLPYLLICIHSMFTIPNVCLFPALLQVACFPLEEGWCGLGVELRPSEG